MPEEKKDLNVLNQEETLKKEGLDGLTEEELAKAKAIDKEVVTDKAINNLLDDKMKAKLEKMLEEANLPIEIADTDFKMGKREVDIRKLSKKNLQQLMFRLGSLACARLMSIDQTLTDIERLIMVLLKKMGVENIADDLAATLKEIMEQSKKLIEPTETKEDK